MEMEREVEDEVYAAFHAVAEGQNEFKLNIYRHIDFTKNELIPPIDKSRQFANKAIVFISLTEGLAESATVFMMVFIIALHFIFGIGSFEHLTTFALVILFLRPPISGLLTSFPALIQGKVAVEKIASLKLSGSTKLPSPPNVDFEQWQSISMKEVEYYYPDSGGERGFHIGPIDLNINRGEVVFIVGGNGSGKSTLAKLLTGLYQPSSGSVTLNTSSGDYINMEAYRHHFSIVLSDFFLFKRLLGANGEKTTTEKIDNYLQLFKLDKKVKVNDDTLSTIDLSQGQRKRLALMAAFLEDKPIILLDEWAADQDPIFRRIFYRELLPELKRKGKTIIAITHDEHYFDLADRVIKLQSGKLNSSKV